MSSVNNKLHNKKVVSNILKRNRALSQEKERQQQELNELVLKESLEVLDKKPQANLKKTEEKINEIVDFHRNRAI